MDSSDNNNLNNDNLNNNSNSDNSNSSNKKKPPESTLASIHLEQKKMGSNSHANTGTLIASRCTESTAEIWPASIGMPRRRDFTQLHCWSQWGFYVDCGVCYFLFFFFLASRDYIFHISRLSARCQGPLWVTLESRTRRKHAVNSRDYIYNI